MPILIISSVYILTCECIPAHTVDATSSHTYVLTFIFSSLDTYTYVLTYIHTYKQTPTANVVVWAQV